MIINTSNTIPTKSIANTNIWDVGQIYDTDSITPELKELLVRMYQNLSDMSRAINISEGSIYTTEEFINSQLFFPNPNTVQQIGGDLNFFRQAIRMVVNFGTLPNAATKSVPHGIQVATNTTWTRIYATATDPVGLTGIPIPYASATAANNIELNVDAVNVNITTGSDRTNYTTCIVVLEYLQD